MELISITYRTTKVVFNMVNILANVKYCLDYPRYKKRLQHNHRIGKNRNGDTCYILGNGPSLKNVDLTLLNDKDVITVNYMVKLDEFEKLKPKMHCIFDWSAYQELTPILKKKVQNSTTNFLFQRKALHDFEKEENVFITYNTCICNTKKIRGDLTQQSTSYINVIPYAIMCAMHAGYKRIVLLGCDFSFFAARKDAHFYTVGKNVKREACLYQDLVGASIALKQFEYIYEYGLASGIEIVNATENSLLDVIPQVDLEDFL